MSTSIRMVRRAERHLITIRTSNLLRTESLGGTMTNQNLLLWKMMPPGAMLLSLDEDDSGFYEAHFSIAHQSWMENGGLSRWLQTLRDVYEVATVETTVRGTVLDVDKHVFPRGTVDTLKFCIANDSPCVRRLATALENHWKGEYRRYADAERRPYFPPTAAEFRAVNNEMKIRFKRRQTLLEVAAALAIGDVDTAAAFLRQLK